MKNHDLNNGVPLPPLEPVLKALNDAYSQVQLVGLSGSSRAWLISGILKVTQRPILMVLPSSDQAEAFYKDLSCWIEWLGGSNDDIIYFPEIDVLPSEKTPPHSELLRQYIETLYHIARRDSYVLIAPVTALIQSVPHPDAVIQSIMPLTIGKKFDRESLMSQWDQMGYRRAELVEQPGEFGVRGSLIDLFSPVEKAPVRIEWVDDIIESMRFFDPETQISKKEVREITVLPIFSPSTLNPSLPPSFLTDHLPPNTIQVWDEPEACYQQCEANSPGTKLASLPFSIGTRPDHKTNNSLRTYPLISFHSLDIDEDSIKPDPQKIKLHYAIQSPNSLGLGTPGASLTTVLQTLQGLRERSRVIIVAKSSAQQEKILNLLHEHELPAIRLAPDHPASDIQHVKRHPSPESKKKLFPFMVAVGTLLDGFYDPDRKLTVVTDEDLFGKGSRHRPLARPKVSRFFSSLEDLKISDYVVHLQHGIGQYQGIQRLTISGFEGDFLKIRYLGGDTLYLPLNRLNLVQKYIGTEAHKPQLDRLGGWTWARTTKRVKKAVEAIAKEILELYAAREVCQGHAFAHENHLSLEFDAAFEFNETPDQLQAIQSIIRDMEQPRPMDRLICGDVGYGKTEVAMRAAFKAVMDNHQVAILVPTTLLAQQHFLTFRQRFSPFPIRVEMLSRFRTPREQKAIVHDLTLGKVDIIIGTHRLLQKDIQFNHLGLLIVDEEQRFGVAHKEQLKQFRKTIDVLTLTATPIPRTLQMSLAQIRDLSIIETPPPDRLSIRTVLTRFDEQVIRMAIQREIARGGQIFFVHNRIEDIERIGKYLSALVPDIRIAIAHGQMRERTLESIMLKFINGEYTLLLCTAIIESGLDIPTANTIFINNAHQFGLSDLYQLRGRVGRANQQAYAYFLIPEHTMTETAQKRLSVLQEFCELGAGFRIAARDLEIRGAGHLLGRKQSGQVAAVGFEYYLQLIEKAVRDLRGEQSEDIPDPVLDLQVSAYIPEDYISDSHQRLVIYKRLSDAMEDGDLSTLQVELIDRYGPFPLAVKQLWEVVQLKLLAKKLAIVKISTAADGVIIVFDSKRKLDNPQIERLLSFQNNILFLSEFSLKFLIPDPSWNTVYLSLKNCLQRLLLYDINMLN